MEDGRAPWYLALWRWLDALLSDLAGRLQRLVRTLRILRALLVLSLVLVVAGAVVAVAWPRWLPVAYAVTSLVLSIPLLVLLTLVGLPLRARSLVRLVDQGYPENARELAIRLAARKLRDQSIETEELLVETGVNEARKAVRRLRRLKEELDAEEGGPPRPDPAREGP